MLNSLSTHGRNDGWWRQWRLRELINRFAQCVFLDLLLMLLLRQFAHLGQAHALGLFLGLGLGLRRTSLGGRCWQIPDGCIPWLVA